MSKVTYIDFDGVHHAVDLEPGFTAMEGAVRNGVLGIPANCGGACACATCHVYVDEAWRSRTGPRKELEESMLEMADDVKPNSRLACQIMMTAKIDGLVVHVPQSA
ncbi:MAG TPA: 2Fe-2S iron-sulfur cluster-binding protein [Steroidobacteraceae bacterium]|nr:2Fe-2S iron-sulfur cluster-binding protein [Steroidobacteraceae bacterium]